MPKSNASTNRTGNRLAQSLPLLPATALHIATGRIAFPKFCTSELAPLVMGAENKKRHRKVSYYHSQVSFRRNAYAMPLSTANRNKIALLTCFDSKTVVIITPTGPK